MKLYQKAILPLFFKASGIPCGIKKSGKPDLAFLYSHLPAKASCVFTANTVQAAPIKVNKQYLKKRGLYRGIIVNSGNANCFTGRAGIRDAQAMTKAAAAALDVPRESVLVASTGIIGKRLPVERIKKAAPLLVHSLSVEGIHQAKKAIMTTDTFDKEASATFMIGERTVTICGIAKGAGMIAPNMATMLAFILTDANITQQALDKALKAAVADSFNCITVDGCMSTNDSVMLLANDAAANSLIDGGKDFASFLAALKWVSLQLAKLIVRDAEGGTKFITITVKGAATAQEAKKAALSIANSNLFKTAVYGQNPNFGRIAAAVGASGIRVKEEKIKAKVSSLKKKDITVEVSVGSGKGSCVVYTSDLTPGYVRINAAYN